MKTAKELYLVTKNRSLLLEECENNTVNSLYRSMQEQAEKGFTSITDDLLSHFTMAVKREEYPTFIPRIMKRFEDLGYTVTTPYKDKADADTVIRISWSVAPAKSN